MSDTTAPRESRLSGRAKVLLPLGLVILFALTFQRFFLADGRLPIHEFPGKTMGTTYLVKVVAEDVTPDRRDEIAGAIENRLERVNVLMSNWDPDSEVSRFNRHASDEPFEVAPETLEVFRVAREVSEGSDGAFDITVAPLVEAWGFGPEGRLPELPDAQTLAEIEIRVGYDLISIDPATRTLTKANPGTTADLSAIAKGYGVDHVAAALDSLGFESYLVEVGGELRARGVKPDGTPWRVAIEAPYIGVREVFEALELIDSSIATSGDYRNFYEVDGIKYAHILDPRTGRPVEHAGASVSVVHERAVVADAWATALSVLGPEEGPIVAEREGVAAYFIARSGEALEPRATSAFEAYAQAAKAPLQ